MTCMLLKKMIQFMIYLNHVIHFLMVIFHVQIIQLIFRLLHLAEISQNIVEKCDYIPGENVPKRTVSGCQPKLYKIPNTLNQGMIINPKLKEYPFIKQLFENNSEIVISMDFLDELS